MMTRLSAALLHRSRRSVVMAAAIAGVVLVSAVDYLTGLGPSFAIFYILIILAVSVSADTTAGVVVATLSAVAWGAAEALIRDTTLSLWVHVWNAVVRGVVLATVVVLVTALVRAVEAAHESEMQSRAFLAAAAHQLRTPVAALSASVEALLLEGATPAQERLLANVAGETSRLGRLVGSLLRAARLDQGEAVRVEAVDVISLCEHELERMAQMSTLECRLVVDDGFPRMAVLDVDATREALSNLLGNARRHAEQRVQVRLSVAGGQMVVEVSDDGPGLPSGAEARAFDRFVTLDGQGGSGLGLAIARDLTRRQGGDVTYARKAFLLTLPLVRAEPAAAEAVISRGRP